MQNCLLYQHFSHLNGHETHLGILLDCRLWLQSQSPLLQERRISHKVTMATNVGYSLQVLTKWMMALFTGSKTVVLRNDCILKSNQSMENPPMLRLIPNQFTQPLGAGPTYHFCVSVFISTAPPPCLCCLWWCHLPSQALIWTQGRLPF